MVFLVALILEIGVLFLLARKVSKKALIFIHKITKNRRLTIYLFAVLFLPGTFVHEMAHFLTALFLLVPVGKVELLPTIEENRIRMGSVAIGKTDMFRRTLVGLAPVMFGLAIILGSVFYVYQNSLFKEPLVLLLLVYIVFEVGNTMFSSKKDLEGALTVFLTGLIIYLFLYIFGLRIYFNINFEVIARIVIFLLAPIMIDLLLIIL